jgi:hypothetical protein
MKKRVKKMVLSRETLVHLENSLEQVAGGASEPSYCGSCPQDCTFSGQRTCNTCQGTCTTNYC